MREQDNYWKKIEHDQRKALQNKIAKKKRIKNYFNGLKG